MAVIHYIAILLFVIAVGLYFVSSTWGIGFLIAGILIETAAWFAAFSDPKKKEKD